MSESAEISIFAFPKLSDFNYGSWKTDMKVLLMEKGCWQFILGTEKPCSEGASDREQLAYELGKQRSYTTIYMGVERKYQALIADTEDGKTAWDTLKANFERSLRARLASLVDDFFSSRFDVNEETIGIYSKKIVEKNQQIKEAGFKMPDILVCFQLIRFLPPEYDNLVQILYRIKDEEFTVNNITKQLITESGRIQLKLKHEDRVQSVTDAYTAGGRNPEENRRKQNTATKSYGSGTVMDPGVRRNRKSSSNFCKYCKRKGHSEDGCFKKKESQDKSFCTENRDPNRLAEMKGLESSNVETTVTRERPAEFLIDSAATTRICNQKDWFSNLKQIYTTEVLVGERDSSAKAVGIGDIKGKVEINLKNVLYVPKMRLNLICGAQIDIVGNYIEWGHDKMIIYNSRKEYMFSVNRVDKLYIVYGYPTKYEAKFKEVALVSNLKLDFVHRRFCHVNIPLIQSMSKNNSVKGIEHLSKSKVENFVNCKIAKSTRSSLKKNYTYRRTTERCLDGVHCDLWGSAPVTSIGGNRYFLSIIDYYSRTVDVYIIKSKDQVFDCFKKYLAKVERELNSKIKCMRSDNGLEFCHKEFENFLTKLGIKMERTSLYTPEQNGIAEKFNRTAMDGVRATLHDSGLQPKFWAEALLTFVHAKNRCEHKLTSPLTPIEIWSGFKPSVRHFRIFGSLAYVHIPKIK
ncbi:Retrovirus-related Pol polyprotein from transposon TNT 1-94 [Araneus ventricosus]|uniref:Retrovirus-related Pol polyprotein from transposon TNT 1-94 n=1 Tax=Araneus ventricosus TaxID=182803 RepID=A0A4Y2MM71_ARAVE|nr:Retrovirus-related Pol polyprotein from transposon TNT 1-94 [Araneus ventricosus]GBN27612.1 Retrovirus-related Pol polyprotein from transposon TNT 1-94 [Araneus ventricosus]